MTATAALLAFTLAAAILTVTPGLDNALVLRTAAVEGGRRALLAGLGISTGCLAWGAAAAFGLGSLLAVSTVAYDVLRIAAAAYLFYLGARLLWNTWPGRRQAGQAGGSALLAAELSAVRLRRRRLVHARLPDQRAQSQDRRVLRHLPAAIHPRRRRRDALQPAAGRRACRARHAVVRLLVAATRPLARWLSRPAVMRGLDRMTGAVFIAFGLKLALEKR